MQQNDTTEVNENNNSGDEEQHEDTFAAERDQRRILRWWKDVPRWQVQVNLAGCDMEMP